MIVVDLMFSWFSSMIFNCGLFFVCVPLGHVNEQPIRAEEMNRLLFELLARWVSGLIPGCALLHIMCKTKKPGEDRPPVDRNRCVCVPCDVPGDGCGCKRGGAVYAIPPFRPYFFWTGDDACFRIEERWRARKAIQV